MEGNGDNEFYIIIKCPYKVYPEEWADLLFQFNHFLKIYKSGKYYNVTANLEREEK